jgi:hypothetical protein
VGSAAAALGLAQLRAAMAARSSGPVDIETERQETRYRLEAELEALSAKLDPRHRAHTVEEPEPNGRAQTLQRNGTVS